MKKQLAFVLGGGGARGALQVGALRALFEAGFYPDLLVGTSIGAVNGAFLAIHGVNLECLKLLEQSWRDAMVADLLPSNYLWLTVRALFNRPRVYSIHRMQDFFITHGLKPDLRFGDLQGVRLVIVATELNSGQCRLYGNNPQELVIEGVLASTALPPWVTPLVRQEELLVDGGTVSNLPIEPALTSGATEIIALDLADPRDVPSAVNGFGPFLGKLIHAVQLRQLHLELALAEARRVPVRYVSLLGKETVPLWDFQYTKQLIATGYEITRQEIARWPVKKRTFWFSWLNKGRDKSMQTRFGL